MGILGGEKFIIGKVFFKYARDHQGLFDGNDALAQKAAMNEIRAASSLIDSQLPNLHTILTVAIRVFGHCMIAAALAPINSKTLVYGSDDAGNTVRFNPTIHEMAGDLAKRLNLALHPLQPSAVGPQVEMWVAGDCEGHRSTVDGRY
jgi:hypothetical protein